MFHTQLTEVLNLAISLWLALCLLLCWRRLWAEAETDLKWEKGCVSLLKGDSPGLQQVTSRLGLSQATCHRRR